jgi:hypothetical protein
MAKRTGEPICARVKADNPELCSRGVHRAPLVMHDFGVRGFYLACKQSTGSRQRHQLGPSRTGPLGRLVPSVPFGM